MFTGTVFFILILESTSEILHDIMNHPPSVNKSLETLDIAITQRTLIPGLCNSIYI